MGRFFGMMPGMVSLSYPFSERVVRSLKTGDRVQVSGTLFTGRDRLHAFLAGGGACPVSLRDGALFHCGPVVLRENEKWRVRAAGPTTSIREEPYMAQVIATHGVRLIIGKGGMGAETLAACHTHGCAYLQAVGGAAAVIARHIVSVEGVHFLDTFGSAEALWQMTVRGLDLVVGMDSHGNSLYENVAQVSRRAANQLMSPASQETCATLPQGGMP